jgi:hypothetical protein
MLGAAGPFVAGSGSGPANAINASALQAQKAISKRAKHFIERRLLKKRRISQG